MEVPASCWQTSWGPFAASVSLVVPRSSPGLTCQSHGCRFDQRPFSLNSPMPWFSVLQTIRYNVLAPLLDLSSSDLSQVGEFSSKTLSFSSHLIPAKGTICVCAHPTTEFHLSGVLPLCVCVCGVGWGWGVGGGVGLLKTEIKNQGRCWHRA